MTQRYTTLADLLQRLKDCAVFDLAGKDAQRISADCKLIQEEINRLSLNIGELIVEHCAAKPIDKFVKDDDVLYFAAEWMMIAAELGNVCNDIRTEIRGE